MLLSVAQSPDRSGLPSGVRGGKNGLLASNGIHLIPLTIQ